MTYLLILFLLTLFPLPWIWVGSGGRPKEVSEVDWIDSVSLGFGIAFCTLYISSHYSLSLFKWIWLVSLALGIAIVARRFKRTRVGNVRWSAEFYILIVSLGLYIAIRAVPLAVAEYPLGW